MADQSTCFFECLGKVACKKILRVWLPLLLLGVLLVVDLVAPLAVQSWMVDENGPLEIGQFIVLLVACGVALYGFCTINKKQHPMVSFLFAAGLGGCIYIAGEEISWGQHFFGWETPESWQAINDQQETNLHNTSSWLDQKPRLILEIGVLVGGLILPFAVKRRLAFIPQRSQRLGPCAS